MNLNLKQIRYRLFLLLFFFVITSLANAGKLEVQNLDAIQEAVDKFMVWENQQNQTHWIADKVNNKTFVPQCLAPFRTRWVAKSYGLSRKSVAVICDKTGDEAFKKWDIFVPVSGKD